jgi:hypothetical protein
VQNKRFQTSQEAGSAHLEPDQIRQTQNLGARVFNLKTTVDTSVAKIRIWIRIRMFLGLPDPHHDPLVTTGSGSFHHRNTGISTV